MICRSVNKCRSRGVPMTRQSCVSTRAFPAGTKFVFGRPKCHKRCERLQSFKAAPSFRSHLTTCPVYKETLWDPSETTWGAVQLQLLRLVVLSRMLLYIWLLIMLMHQMIGYAATRGRSAGACLWLLLLRRGTRSISDIVPVWKTQRRHFGSQTGRSSSSSELFLFFFFFFSCSFQRVKRAAAAVAAGIVAGALCYRLLLLHKIAPSFIMVVVVGARKKREWGGGAPGLH